MGVDVCLIHPACTASLQESKLMLDFSSPAATVSCAEALRHYAANWRCKSLEMHFRAASSAHLNRLGVMLPFRFHFPFFAASELRISVLCQCGCMSVRAICAERH